MECCFGCILFPCIKCCPTVMSVPTQSIAEAMAKNVAIHTTEKVEIINNVQIHELADRETM